MAITILALLAAALLAVASPTRAETPAGESAVERAVSWLTRMAPAHPVQRKPEWRRKLSRGLNSSASKNGIPPLFWTGVAFRESSFRTSARGALGEVGLVQVHGRAARGCKLDTPEGQLDCGASWLAHCVERCGSLRGGFTMYASGRVCKADTKHLRDVVDNRFRLWRKLEEVTRDEAND